MNVLGIAGWSGSGKTTLVTRLLVELVGRGVSVSTVKHAHHDFDIDQVGKDSHKHRQAGARQVMVSSRVRWALIEELGTSPELGLDELLKQMSPVDLVLVEGFKFGHHEKIEVYRKGCSDSQLFPDDPNIIAVASDVPLSGVNRPVLDLNNVAAIGEFIVARWDLGVQKNDSA